MTMKRQVIKESLQIGIQWIRISYGIIPILDSTAHANINS
jgi:hypothetical protein